MKRSSNIELLRIVAMMMIVLLHANYYSLGGITLADVKVFDLGVFLKAVAEQLCIIGVNVFVLISGWFGIRPSVKGALSLMFQVWFFNLVIAAVMFCLGQPVSWERVLDVMFLKDCYWFVVAYIALYVLAPVLNAFIEKAPARQYLSVLVAFFCIEFMFGWIMKIQAAGFHKGYSAMSFIGLYLLAGYLKRHSAKLVDFSVRKDFLLYLAWSVVPVALYFLIKRPMSITFYSSPFVIAASVFFFLAFNRMNFTSGLVNYLACSAFSIYLIHLHPLVSQHFKDAMRWGYELLGGWLYVPFAVAFAVALGLACVMLDKVRIWVWGRLWRG